VAYSLHRPLSHSADPSNPSLRMRETILVGLRDRHTASQNCINPLAANRSPVPACEPCASAIVRGHMNV
jgi:hypothetical protein